MSSLKKIFSVIEAIVSHQSVGLTYTEVVSMTDLPKASVHRTMKELTELGYLAYDMESKKYRGSLKLATLGAEVMTNFDLRQYLHPYLLELNRETEHTVHLGVRNGISGFYLDKVESRDYGIKLFSDIGKTFPLNSTGLGKVLLAHAPQKVVELVLTRPFVAHTETTITDPEAFRRELKNVAQKGFAIDNEEITRGIMCVAAPVFGVNSELICAISLTFPTYIYQDRGITREIEVIKQYTAKISGAMVDRG